MIIILKAIIGWFLFMLIGTNLIGIIVRGFLQSVSKPEISEPLLIKEYTRFKKANIILATIFLLILFGYFYLLYYFWNFGVSISAGMIMFSRIPDLLSEINTGQKVKFGARPKTPLDYFTIIIQIGAFPVLWYSLYVIK